MRSSGVTVSVTEARYRKYGSTVCTTFSSLPARSCDERRPHHRHLIGVVAEQFCGPGAHFGVKKSGGPRVPERVCGACSRNGAPQAGCCKSGSGVRGSKLVSSASSGAPSRFIAAYTSASAAKLSARNAEERRMRGRAFARPRPPGSGNPARVRESPGPLPSPCQDLASG